MALLKTALWARRSHKWIAIVIGVQALLWMLSGLYMTAISIDVIHGDHLVEADLQPLSPSALLIDLARLSAQFPGMTGFRLKRFMGREVYEVHVPDQAVMVDAQSGARLSPLNEVAARRLAASLYRGNAPILTAELLTKAPREVSNRPVPLWRISFADSSETALYLSPHTGDLLAKRHTLWRWFDLLWMLHIMDYQERSDVNNTLLRVAGAIGLVFALSGVWLLFYSFRTRRSA